MNEEEVKDLMKSSQTEAEWNANCNKVKAAFGGVYPSFWYQAIVASGLSREMTQIFACSDEIKINTL